METHWRICRITSRQLSLRLAELCITISLLGIEWLRYLHLFKFFSILHLTELSARLCEARSLYEARSLDGDTAVARSGTLTKKNKDESKFMTFQSDFRMQMLKLWEVFITIWMIEKNKKENMSAFGWNRFKEIDPDGDFDGWMGLKRTFQRLSTGRCRV